MKKSVLIAATFLLSTFNASAMTPDELKQVTAAIINMNGLLCADVVDIRPLELDGQFEVTCIEYRGGSGTVRYIMNAKEGTAFKA
ncbi:hypothetical protein [Mesorhizobium australicum]|uniref:hypothetical protein n=1 Tax=Mesorhizobium australicum TaxID=536018 RepID=UPI00333E15F5